MPSHGIIEYTERAFQQDAELAIKNDIVRALVELITNSDDAYGDNSGDIYIQIDPPSDADRTSVTVMDSAKGLSKEKMVEKFTKLGGQNSAFQAGEKSRGLLGRGAKDVASLGGVTFKSVHEGKYSELHLAQSGEWNFLVEEVLATTAHKENLRLTGNQNGMSVVIHVLPQIKLPKGAKLQEYLSTHAQLREIIQRHDVYVIDKRPGGVTGHVTPRVSEMTNLLDTEIEIPGYEGKATLILNRLKNPSRSALSSYSEHGILVKSGITIYQNTLFGNENHPQATLISGEVVVPQINQLVRDYDAGKVVDGGRLITRDRDGLANEHPFTRALSKAVLAKLLPILKELLAENEKNQGQGESLTRALKDAASALRNEVNDFLRELDEKNSGSVNEDIPPISAIPPRLNLLTNSSGWVTVRVTKETSSRPKAEIGMDSPKGVISALVPSEITWKKHERLEVFQTSIQIQSGDDLGSGVVTVFVDDKAVNIPVIVREEPEVAPAIPTTLKFTTENARIAPTRTRKLLLLAPLEDADREVEVVVSGVSVATYTARTILKVATNEMWCEAVVEVKAALEVGDLEITAKLQSYEDAKCLLKIAEGGPLGGTDLDFELVSGNNRPRRENVWNNAGTITIHVEADHPAFGGVFGKFDSNQGKYSEEDSRPARVALAESLARGLAEYLIEQEALKRPQDYSDGAKYFNRSHELTNKFIKTFNAAFAN